MSPPPPSTPPRPRPCANRSASSPATRTAESYGHPTTCTKSRKSATGCCSCRTGKFCWKATRARCPHSTAPIRSRSCSSSSPVSRCTRAGSTLSEATAGRGHSAATAIPLPQQPGTPAADLRLGGDRHSSVGIPDPLPELGRRQPPQLRADPPGSGAVLGFLHAHHAGSDHGLPGGCLVTKLPEPVRDAAVDLRVRDGARTDERRDEL